LLIPEYDIVFLLDEAAQAGVAKQWPCQALSEYMPQVEPEYVWQIVGETAAGIDWKAAEQAFHYKDGWYTDTAGWLMGFTLRRAFEMTQRIMALEHLKESRELSGILLHEDITGGANFIAQWARANEVPCVHVAHGGYGRREAYPGQDWDPHLKLRADVVCVWNEAQQASYLRQGAAPASVRLTGAGIMDHWFDIVPDKRWAKEMFGLDPDRPVLTWLGDFATFSIDSVAKQIDAGFATICEAMKLLSDWQFIVRPHPGQHPWMQEWHAKMLKEHDMHGTIVMGDYMELIAQASDVFYTATGSTACVEASIVGTPTVVTADSLKDDPFYIWAEAGNPQALTDAIKVCRGREKTGEWRDAKNKALYELCWLADGKATERVMAVINEYFKHVKAA
jgi:hypothetical protein